jgi:hypothetical protein
VDQDSWVKVAYIDIAGIVTDLTYGTHYTTSGVGGSGGITVTYPGASSPAPYAVALPTGASLLIDIQPPQSQSFNPKHNGAYSPATIGATFDKVMRLLHKHTSDLTRTLRVSRGSSTDASTLTFDDYTKQRVLLFEATAIDANTVEALALNWPASHDRVELEVNGVKAFGAGLFTFKPMDSGSATDTYLSSIFREMVAGSVTDNAASDWAFITNQGTTADDALSGSAIFTYNAGFLNGYGDWTYRSGSNHIHVAASYQWHTAVGTQWDGIEVSNTGGAITGGTVRLWGMPKT